MNVRKRIFAFLFAVLAMALLTACGRWDYSREAVKAANEAQGQTLRVEFKVNQTFTNALRAAAEDNIQPDDVDKAMTMDKSIEKLLTSGYRLDVYALRADVDADQAAAQLADEFIDRLSGCEDEGYISMVKAENGYFYEAVLVYKHSGDGSGSGSGSGNEGGDSSAQWVSWDSGKLHFMRDADQHIDSTLSSDDLETIKSALVAYGDLDAEASFSFSSVINLAIDQDSGIKTIGESVFGTSDSRNPNKTLQSVTLAGVTELGDNAFQNCRMLNVVDGTEQLTTVGDYAFYSTTELKTISLPNVTDLGMWSFYISGLTFVSIPSVTEIETYTFAGTSLSSTESIVMPKVTSCGNNSFYSCDKLSSFDFSKITELGNAAFAYSGLTEVDGLVTSTIPQCAFQGCRKLETVDLTGVKNIGLLAFDGCSVLQTIKLDNDLTDIESMAFQNVASSANKTVNIYCGTGEDDFIAMLKNAVGDNPLVGTDEDKMLEYVGLDGHTINYYSAA